MKALVLGIGFQGKAVVHDLSASPVIDEIIAVDMNLAGTEEFLKRGAYTKARAVKADVLDRKVLTDLIKQTKADVLVCMLPSHVSGEIAKTCVQARIHFVNTSYAHWLEGLDEEAKANGVALLSEMGFDPGIDLILGAKAVAELDEVHGLYSYGAGIPEKEACDNPLNYKITWTFDGVLQAYNREARMLQNGQEVCIPDSDIFKNENIHMIVVQDLGALEAYPNGDAINFIKVFGLGPSLKEMGRFAARWPGHCAYWQVMSAMGFLDDEPVDMGDGVSVSPVQFVSRLMTPRLQFKDDERDVAVLKVHAWGLRNGEKKSVIYEMLDYRDPATGFFAMNRTVGFTASIGAQMILHNEITGKGILSPVRDVNGDRVLEELALRGVKVACRTS
ncbi:MAG: hypothetical protein GY749_44885 [Desulfobacteraceae bacterium]|nr:hypothetical protein [Desulfobacteraceae bacterium]